jgi:hypothetical protein
MRAAEELMRRVSERGALSPYQAVSFSSPLALSPACCYKRRYIITSLKEPLAAYGTAVCEAGMRGERIKRYQLVGTVGEATIKCLLLLLLLLLLL